MGPLALLLVAVADAAKLLYPAEIHLPPRTTFVPHYGQTLLDVFEPGDTVEMIDSNGPVTGCEIWNGSVKEADVSGSTYVVPGTASPGTRTVKNCGFDDVDIRFVADAHHSPKDYSGSIPVDATKGIWFARHTPAELADFYAGLGNAPNESEFNDGGDLTPLDPDEDWVPRAAWWFILDQRLPTLHPGDGFAADCGSSPYFHCILAESTDPDAASVGSEAELITPENSLDEGSALERDLIHLALAAVVAEEYLAAMHSTTSATGSSRRRKRASTSPPRSTGVSPSRRPTRRRGRPLWR